MRDPLDYLDRPAWLRFVEGLAIAIAAVVLVAVVGVFAAVAWVLGVTAWLVSLPFATTVSVARALGRARASRDGRGGDAPGPPREAGHRRADTTPTPTSGLGQGPIP